MKLTGEKQTTSDEKIKQMEYKSILYRQAIMKLIFESKSGHTGGSLSCVDILNVLYNHAMDITPENFLQIDRDHYIHSKGHSVEALYVVLADMNFFKKELLSDFEKYSSNMIGHPTRFVNGIEQNTGALGHGLSISVGMALAAKMDQRNNRIFTIMGDGELAEGSIWEASASAAHYGLDNLIAIIDRNHLQITGHTDQVMKMEPLENKFAAFGFAVREVNGNSIAELAAILNIVPFEEGKPNLILANTIKGRGISYMENNALWHHKVPSDAEYQIAVDELDLAKLAWEQHND
ncbi:MAG: transketolase [Anaerolineaceae bacterium]|nr:transketolase [Anaerolineaceae bacterium]